ncbi:TetR/AcrR family transcriptional regulator [Streptomyces cavernae]|uniref:TetR/AcrR family transcriptional regulator n=1 Tax=Streptomyces cavernae TaxID=2259034 RepID=UPI000FEBBC8A|nr:TetR/AcrR family transcriptional regulator [Streptomyces cavernae]
MRADARRNHQRLVREAAVAFAEHGEGASLDDIAKRAGVGSGTLYRHFPTRQALLEAVYADRIEEIAARGHELADRLPAGDALVEWLAELGERMIQVRALKALLGSAVTDDGGSAVLTECGTSVKDSAARLVEAAQRHGAVRGDVEPIEVLRLVHGVATASELSGGNAECIRRYLSLLTDGLRPTAGRPD